jgi:predicted NAD/FAD-dependent oxidoreductase
MKVKALTERGRIRVKTDTGSTQFAAVLSTASSRANYSPLVSTTTNFPTTSVTPAPTIASGDWVLNWLASDRAAPYVGRWVAIAPDLEVRGSGSSPSDLVEHNREQGVVIALVIPRNVKLLA